MQQNLLSLHGIVYSPQQSQTLLDSLISDVDWQTNFLAYGRQFDIPRLQAWYADEGVHYRYTDNMLQSHAWVEPLLSIQQRVEDQSGHLFNSVLLTYYRDGNDYVNWHADDEPELGDAPVIASLSFGASREFHYRHKERDESGSMQLHDGELLVMQPAFQEHWEHAALQQPEVVQPRINLTFRKVMT